MSKEMRLLLPVQDFPSNFKGEQYTVGVISLVFLNRPGVSLKMQSTLKPF